MNVYELKPSHVHWRLGRGGMAYLAVTLVILSTAVYSQANLMFWALGLMIGGFVVTTVLMACCMRNLSVYRMLPNHGVTDEPLVLRYQIANRSKLAVFGLLVCETWGKGDRGWTRSGAVVEGLLGSRPSGWLLHLGPKQTLQAEAVCWPRRRGVLRFERIVLESGFPFAIMHKVLEFDAPAEVLVYPRLFRIHRRLLSCLSRSESGGSKQTDRRGGTEDFFGLRAYRAGDSVRLIDWKHTASTGQMVVREMTRPSLPQVMILLELRGPDGKGPDNGFNDACERAISLTASLACDAYLNGYQIGLEVAGKGAAERVLLHHSLPHRTRIIDMLAKLDYSHLGNLSAKTERPTVIVRVGSGGPGMGQTRGSYITRPLILGGDDLEQYVQAGDSGSLYEMIQRSTPMSLRRRQGGLFRSLLPDKTQTP